MDRITMLGTGHAMVFACFNTCFVYENENGKMLAEGPVLVRGSGTWKYRYKPNGATIDKRIVFDVRPDI